MMDLQIVIMKYNEDVRWTEHLDSVIIYNKGVETISKHKVINLPNLGMGFASMLYHIIKNYDNLAEVTVFLPGNPFDGVHEEARNWKNDLIGIRSIVDYYSYIPKGEYMSSHTMLQHIGDKYYQPPNYNQRHHDEFIKFTVNWTEWIKLLDPYNQINWYEPIRFYKNGHFGITKEAILSNPIEYYIMMIDHWKYSNPVADWNSESTLNFLFNVANDGKIYNFGHNDFDYSNLKNYEEWLYEF